MKKNKKAFTLVELIVVATILTILATIGFISYEEYLVDTRDSKRLAQLSGLRDGLRLGITKWKLPLPDDNIEIRNNGTAFLYQWYAGKNVLEGISYSEATKDPYDETYYTYLLSWNRKDFQILGFLEKYNPNIITTILPQTHAIDYSQRFPQVMGKKLWIVLEQDTNTPLQEIAEYVTSGYMDLNDTTTNLFDAYVTGTQLISWNENDLVWIIPFTTCKKIQANGDSYGNGYYSINPSWLNPFEVYCDMDMDGGWWNLVWRSSSNGVPGSFWWLASWWSVRDDSNTYSLWEDVLILNFSEIMLWTYTTWKNIEEAIKFSIIKSEYTDPTRHQYASLTSGCTELLPAIDFDSPCNPNLGVTYWWGLLNSDSIWWWIAGDRFFFSRYSTTTYTGGAWLASIQSWLLSNWFHTDEDDGVFEWEQTMIFVR